MQKGTFQSVNPEISTMHIMWHHVESQHYAAAMGELRGTNYGPLTTAQSAQVWAAKIFPIFAQEQVAKKYGWDDVFAGKPVGAPWPIL